MKLSKLADYAVVVLAEMAGHPGALKTAPGLAERTGLPEPTVSKVLKLLTKGGVVTSMRGVNGGYRLEKAPDGISVAAIITAMDGPVAMAACVHGVEGCCAYERNCGIKKQWDPVNSAVKQALENVTLAQMMAR